MVLCGCNCCKLFKVTINYFKISLYKCFKMNLDICAEFPKVPQNPLAATQHVVELLLFGICPLLQKLRSKLQSYSDFETEDEIVKVKNVFMLCSSQIKKCIMNFLDILKTEHRQRIYLQESRQFIFERLSCCITKLSAVEKSLDICKIKENLRQDLSEDPMFATNMYFVNWIDYTFEILGKLAENIYRTDYKTNANINEKWKENMIEYVTSLHMCIDELLLSAMTLCKYCLPENQTILRARCQVVLRETRVLFSELIKEDISTTVKATPENLKLPIMPSNVNIMIDVLKDVLYVLETNTNTALLALLIHCYVNCAAPVDLLKDHFNSEKDHTCPCARSNVADIEECEVVKDFDLYNERLLQIGSFAVSCSSDQKRILTLRSCLSSLESLDPHLVPAMTTSPSGHHAELLANFWREEVLEIRETVFLIVDPIAFVEKCKQYMHDRLLDMRKQESYETPDLWVVMNIGRMVAEFFSIYKKYEPDAIAHYEGLDKLLENVNRAQRECNTVSDYFFKNGNYFFDIKIKSNHSEITFESFITRVKLLYSMVKRVHELLRPKDDQLFGEDEAIINRNMTHTVYRDVNTDTYTNCQRKPDENLTRSMFARTGNVKTSTRNVFLDKLTKHLKVKKGVQDELSFSAQVSELFNVEKEVRKPTIGATGKISLRKAVLSNQCDFPFMRKLDTTFDVKFDQSDAKRSQQGFMDEAESLQISEILNEINDITNLFSTTGLRENPIKLTKTEGDKDSSTYEGLLEDNELSNVFSTSQPSNFTTLERLNDLDLVESKLNSLRTNSDFETHL